MFSTAGREFVAAIIGSSGLAMPGWISIGTGSGTALATNKVLVSEQDRNAVNDIDVGTNRFITWTGNFSSTEMSGLALTEFGLNNISSGGSVWLRQAFGSQQFDGTDELSIDVEVEVY